MPLEEEMHHEIERLEAEIAKIDDDVHKLSVKIMNLINIRKKKEHDLKILKETFGIIPTETEEIQLSLSTVLKQKV